MFIKPSDFLLLVNNLHDFMQIVPTINAVESDKNGFPVMMLSCKLGSINLYCMHYSSFDEAKSKWEERKTRINYNHLLVIMTDRDGFSEEDLKVFEGLSIPKVLYTSKQRNICNTVFVKAFRKSENVGIMTDFCVFFGESLL